MAAGTVTPHSGWADPERSGEMLGEWSSIKAWAVSGTLRNHRQRELRFPSLIFWKLSSPAVCKLNLLSNTDKKDTRKVTSNTSPQETWRTASLSKHLRSRTPNPCHPDTWLHVRWRRWVSPFYPHTSWHPPWRSFPSSYLFLSVWLGAETVLGGPEMPASRPSRWLLQRLPKWRRKGLRLWRKKGRDGPSFSRWRASGEAHRLCTTQDQRRAASPRLHRLVWTPVTQTRHNERVRGRSEGWQDWNSMYFAHIFPLNSSFKDVNLQYAFICRFQFE